MKPLTKTQRSVLQYMADGWRLIHRVYDYCALFPPEHGKTITVRTSTLYALLNAKYIVSEGGLGLSRRFTLTDAGRLALDAPPAGGKSE